MVGALAFGTAAPAEAKSGYWSYTYKTDKECEAALKYIKTQKKLTVTQPCEPILQVSNPGPHAKITGHKYLLKYKVKGLKGGY